MEIKITLDDTWYFLWVVVDNYRPERKFKFYLDHKPSNEDYEIIINYRDVQQDKKHFKIYGAKKWAKQLRSDCSTKYWEFLKNISTVLNHCTAYQDAKVIVEKACSYDTLQFIDKPDVSKTMSDKKDISRNSNIKIFEFQLPKGVLQWVAAESLWKAALWFMCDYEICCVEDEILDIVELPKQKWSEYMLCESDGRQVPFDKVINRRRVFPQTIAITEENGKIESSPDVDNIPLCQTI